MFRILQTPLEDCPLGREMANSGAGGHVTFEGWVRDHNDGKTVIALEYEAYDALAEKEGQRILDEAKAQFEIMDARCLHRTGLLKIGDMAVWVGVTAAHRKAAFEACEYVIQEVKHRLPIWKKETYDNGDSGWIHCQHDNQHSSGLTEEDFYSRQVVLPEIGRAGQDRLKKSKVLVVGAGGLGCAALQALAAAGIGTLGICEPDCVEASNLHRQLLYSPEDLHQSKAEMAARHLRRLNPFIQVQTHPVRLDAENAPSLFAPYEWVLDCTDNFEAKYALNDAAVGCGKSLIQAGIYQYEGQLTVYRPEAQSPCLRCLWPEPPEPGAIDACAMTGVLGATAALFGHWQALELIKQVLDMPGRLTSREWLAIDLLSQTMHRFKRDQNPACPVSHDGGELPHHLNQAPCGWVLHPEMSDETLSDFVWVDISEENDSAHFPPGISAIRAPYGQLAENPSALLTHDAKFLLVCPYGGRSLYLAKQLRRRGMENIFSLAGGWQTLAMAKPKPQAPAGARTS
jgi:molybdopterin/thiamine biosynthesis adenylyltransferase/molybdopterin synthase catalytic subunit/rhodanese-related sulfurtransferase